VPLHKRRDIEFGLLDHLNLADVAVLDREDAGGLPLDLLASGASDQRLDKGLEVSLASQSAHGGDHLLADGANLGGFGITRLFQLVILFLREGDAEHAHDVAIGGTGVHIPLDDALLLLDQRAQLIAGHIHAVEVQEAVVPLHVFHAELHLTVTHGLIVVEVGEGELDDASLKSVRSNLGSLGFGDNGLTAFLHRKDGGGNQLVPFLLEEGVDCLLLSALLGLGKSLVLSLSLLKMGIDLQS
jgi:hypothetical protein